MALQSTGAGFSFRCFKTIAASASFAAPANFFAGGRKPKCAATALKKSGCMAMMSPLWPNTFEANHFRHASEA
jgi:hypothetical protein